MVNRRQEGSVGKVLLASVRMSWKVKICYLNRALLILKWKPLYLHLTKLLFWEITHVTYKRRKRSKSFQSIIFQIDKINGARTVSVCITWDFIICEIGTRKYYICTSLAFRAFGSCQCNVLGFWYLHYIFKIFYSPVHIGCYSSW